jgi:hypothetical protein
VLCRQCSEDFNFSPGVPELARSVGTTCCPSHPKQITQQERDFQHVSKLFEELRSVALQSIRSVLPASCRSDGRPMIARFSWLNLTATNCLGLCNSDEHRPSATPETEAPDLTHLIAAIIDLCSVVCTCVGLEMRRELWKFGSHGDAACSSSSPAAL